MTQYGQTPNVWHGGQTPGQKRLFHSVRDIALILDKTVKAGYGVLKIGTVMAVNSADSKLIPYPETSYTVNNTNGKTFLLASGTNGSAIVYTTVEDSYKFAVGDSLIIDCNGATAQNLGAITAIDRTDTGGTRAKITATTNLSDADGDFTTANSVNVYCKGGDTSAPFTKAEYILDKDIDTGTGEDATGALASVVISNAVLYTSSLVGLDAAAKTDLSSVTDGRFTILK